MFYTVYLRVVFVDVRELCAILHNAPLKKATPLWLARNHDKKGKRERRGRGISEGIAKAKPEEIPGP